MKMIKYAPVSLFKRVLLHVLLTKTQTYFENINQPYLGLLYSTLFSTAYHGLFRVGEITEGSHTVKVIDVHIAKNKDKFLFILRSSKTHGAYSHPQSVKISSRPIAPLQKKERRENCPFELLRSYAEERPKYQQPSEPFFIFRNMEPVQPQHMRSTLKLILQLIELDSDLYNCHSFRAGKALDLYRNQISVETIKKLGRWRSNIVFSYLK